MFIIEGLQEGAKRLTEIGSNGEVLNLELPRVQPREIPEGDEVKIQAIIKNKAINRAGGLCKVGFHVVNAHVLLEANRRIEE